MYTLHFSEPAEEDLLSTIRYISDVLKAPEAAKHLLNEVEEQTKILKTAPLSYALVFDEYLYSKGIRSFLVKNYLIFYVVNEKEKIVSIIRFLYARRDWTNLLRNENK